MDADNIVGHHVDYEVIKKLDSQYSAKKFQKLEERFTNPIIILLPTKPPKTTTVKKVETKTSIVFHHHDEENE